MKIVTKGNYFSQAYFALDLNCPFIDPLNQTINIKQAILTAQFNQRFSMDRIILIAQQIAKEGKIPNTAMIKARLPKNVPLPAIIQGLKLWQENPNKEIDSPTEPALIANEKTEIGSFDALLEAKITALLTPLKDEITQLKAEIQKLKESN